MIGFLVYLSNIPFSLLTTLTEANTAGSAGAPERRREDSPSSALLPHQHGPTMDLAVAGPDSASLEAAHRAIDRLADRHRLATEAANRARQRLEDWQRRLATQQTELMPSAPPSMWQGVRRGLSYREVERTPASSPN